jgi:hypothetical protein
VTINLQNLQQPGAYQPASQNIIGIPGMGATGFGLCHPSTSSLNQQSQKMIAKRAAAKVVRKKVSESQQTSKSMISQ